jgi:hypothetical protein
LPDYLIPTYPSTDHARASFVAPAALPNCVGQASIPQGGPSILPAAYYKVSVPRVTLGPLFKRRLLPGSTRLITLHQNMPVTKGRQGVLEITQDTSSLRAGDYLNSLSPSWITPRVVLSILIALWVLLVCARSVYSWSSKSPPATHLTQTIRYPKEFDGYPAYMGAGPMDEKSTRPKSGIEASKGHHVSFTEAEPSARAVLAIDPNWSARQESLPRQLISRPPPAPPLTPPELSNTVFTFDDRPRNSASFFHQPNPDYASVSTTTSTSQSSSASPPTPRRRSYNKTLPIGIPVPLSASGSESDTADLTFSPSSYPPTSPLLPPAPPGMLELEDDSKTVREIDVRGEIISVVDGDGAGWTRHTRVYGGGVCLACAASGGDHSGGFYGATVRPEEMR